MYREDQCENPNAHARYTSGSCLMCAMDRLRAEVFRLDEVILEYKKDIGTLSKASETRYWKH